MKKGFFWLASYPKSGNTWFRIFFANLLNSSNQPINLNHLNTGVIASSRSWIDESLGFSSADLSHDEIDALRPYVYTWLSETCNSIEYHKIHDAYTYLNNGTPLIPTAGCLGVIYFVRNPLDIAISFANHLNCSIDETIQIMGNSQFAFCKNPYKQYNQLRQWLLSWSLHVQSWMNAKYIRRLVIRYEDMISNPQATFTQAVEFLHINASPEQIASALDHAKIEKLQKLESEMGFLEKPANSSCFFRKGIAGDWKNILTSVQIKQIIQDHKENMQLFDYYNNIY